MSLTIPGAKVQKVTGTGKRKMENLSAFSINSGNYRYLCIQDLNRENVRIWLVVALLAVALHTAAQENHPWEQYLNEVTTMEEAESASWEDTYELLCELEQHPLDINRATREQLEELPFLSPQQVEGVMEYLYRYGPLKSVEELRMIRALDYAQRRLLTYFIYIGDEQPQGFPKMKNILKYGRQELMGSLRVPLYERRGDRNGYLGYPYRHWLRYQFSYGETVRFGLVGAQDAGEPFFAHQNRAGYDYYAPYFQLRNLGRLSSLCVGSYRVSMGMGLVINQGFSLGKVAMLQNMGRPAHTIRAHSSRSADYLQGVAATLGLGRGLALTAFLSYRPHDATLNKDGTAATLLTSGYHRTKTDMEKKDNLHALKAGGSLRFGAGGLHLGLNVLYAKLDRELNPGTSMLYRRHYPQGSSFLNMSVDYGLVRPRFALSGETAADKAGHLATVNSLSLRLGEAVNLMAFQRFYSYRYTSLDARSYSEGGRVQNESGAGLGLTWQPSPRLRLAAYTDYAYFAWARYQVSQSSRAWDHLVQASLQRYNWTFGARYRLRLRQRDEEGKKRLQNRTEHWGRLSADYASGLGWSSHTQLDGSFGTSDGPSWGAMLSESLSYTYRWLRLNGGAGYFHADSNDRRVYLYERAPLYNYAMMQFGGEGIRYWLMARAGIGQRLMLTAKVGVTDYFDRSVIGTGYQQVDASSMTDVDVQVRWKF